MSNKVLIYLLIGLIVIVALVVLVWSRGTGSDREKFNNINMQEEIMPPEGNKQDNVVTEAMNGCVRNFDRDVLATASVDLEDREVEMQIKGFGNIKVELYEKDAPKTVENFLRLVNSGFYDCLTFHRVSKGFVIQGGDPTGTGTGGESVFGGRFEDELNPETDSYKSGYKQGVLAMANSGPNTNSSQFFIMLEDTSLQKNYTIFGKVIEGQEVVNKIGQVDIVPQNSPTDGTPVDPVVIEKASIIE